MLPPTFPYLKSSHSGAPAFKNPQTTIIIFARCTFDFEHLLLIPATLSFQTVRSS